MVCDGIGSIAQLYHGANKDPGRPLELLAGVHPNYTHLFTFSSPQTDSRGRRCSICAEYFYAILRKWPLSLRMAVLIEQPLWMAPIWRSRADGTRPSKRHTPPACAAQDSRSGWCDSLHSPLSLAQYGAGPARSPVGPVSYTLGATLPTRCQ